jgi:predicted HTH transcriptional regulator
MKEIQGFIKRIVGLVVSIMIIGVLVKRVFDSRFKERNKKVFEKPLLLSKGISTKITKKSEVVKEKLSKRQQEILGLFEKKTKIFMEDITLKIKGVHVRTIRRELSKLTKLGYIKKVGSTKGSFYTKK